MQSRGTITANEMQLVYDVREDKYLSIHDIESNIKQEDSTTYFDQNFDMNAQF